VQVLKVQETKNNFQKFSQIGFIDFLKNEYKYDYTI
jgi:hypothetical protein